MKLDYAFFADSAQVLEDGRFYVLAGNIDALHAARFPMTRQVVTLVARLALTPTECGQSHRFDAYFTDPQGRELAPRIESSFMAQLHSRHSERGGSLAAVLEFCQITFSVAGDYLAHLLVNGQEVGALPLEVVHFTAKDKSP